MPEAALAERDGSGRGLTGRQAKWLTVLAFVVYVQIAIWMRYGLHYFINDAIARNYNARMMLFGRRPTLTAMGFYWMPIPVFAQLPFVALLEPFHLAPFAGPLSTAVLGAGTVAVLARLTKVLEVPRGAALVLVGAYAFNPVVMFVNANGMSEAALFFFLAVAMTSYFAWIRSDNTVHLAGIALGLAGATGVRYEVLLVAPIVAMLAAIHRRGVRHALPTALVTVLPSAFVFAVWLAANRLIQGSAFSFLHVYKPPPAQVAHVSGDMFGSLRYATEATLRFAPALVVLVPVVVSRAFRRGVAPLAPILAGLPFVALQVYLLSNGSSQGDPRYFESLTLFTAIAALWWCSTRVDRFGAPHRATLAFRSSTAACLLVVSSVTGSLSLAQPSFSRETREFDAFRPALGLSHPERAPTSLFYDGYVELTRQVDAQLDAHPGEVLVDGTAEFELLYTRHPTHFIIDVDLDWQSSIADGGKSVRYLLVAGLVDNAATVVDPALNVASWRKLYSSAAGSFYEHDVA